MPVEITLSKTAKKNLAELQKLTSPRAFNKAMLEFFERQASIGADWISDNYASGQRLKRRTGNLAKSIIGRSVMVGSVPGMRIGVLRGPALRYAGVQEYGTKGKNASSPYPTIRPKSAKALSIPMKPALTPAGVERFGGPRGLPDGFLAFVPFRSGKNAVGGLFEKSTLGGALKDAKMYYLLVKEVDIEPKWYLRDGFNKWLPQLSRNIADYLRDVLVGVREKNRGR